MIPLDIELENFKQHAHLKFVYKPGITGIFGENGAGKSNFVTLAEFFGLTGELPSGVEAGAKSALLSWGAKQGSVTFRFMHDSILYTIKRQLKGKDVTLTCTRQDGTSIDISGHTAVNAKLEALYGVPMAIVQEQCFVPQGKLDDCVNMTHAQRMAYFQRLIPGLMRAESLRGIIQDGINKLPVYPDRTEDLKELRAKCLLYNKELQRVNLEISEWSVVEKSYREAVEKGKSKRGLPSETSIKNKIIELQDKIETLKPLSEGLVAPSPVQEPLEEANKLIQLNTDLVAQEPVYLKATTKVCPTCNRAYTFETEDEPKKIIVEYQALKEQIKVLTSDLKLKKDLYRKYLQVVEDIRRKELKESTNMAITRTLKQQLEEVKKTPYITDAIVQRLNDLDQAVIDLTEAIHKSVTEREVLKVNIKTTHEQIIKYEAEQQKNVKSLKLKQLLERSREILHRDNLPRIILFKLLAAINNSMAIYLNKFHVVFTAQLNDEFDFVCTFPANGITDVSARDTLSGGQKVALALAFHFAKSDILGASIPLLVLDEPTAYLNTINKEALCKVFGEARKFAEAGWYVMVSTHETMLETAMSNIIRIGV